MAEGSGGSIGFCGILFIVFLILKLCNAITWSWWWVTAPLWAPLALGVGIILICWVISSVILLIRNLGKFFK